MYGTIGVQQESEVEDYNIVFRPDDVKIDPAAGIPTYELHGNQSLIDFFHMIGIPESAIREATEELQAHHSCSMHNVRIHIRLLRRFGADFAIARPKKPFSTCRR
jgi:hypothetical protein